MQLTGFGFSVFFQGFLLGMGPCILSCGPVVLPFIFGNKHGAGNATLSMLSFSLGRLLIYAVFGAVFGLFGSLIISLQFSLPGSVIRAAGALYVIFLGLSMLFNARREKGLCTVRDRDVSNKNMFVLGMFFGLMPCIPLTAILVQIAMFSDNIASGAIFGMVFGLGTVISPLLLLAGMAGYMNSFLKDPGRCAAHIRALKE